MESEAQVPLKNRAAIFVAASVWYHEDVFDAVRKAISNQSYDANYWLKAQSRVNKNIKALPLTVHAKQHVQDFSAFIASSIEKWLHDNFFVTVDGKVLSNLLCWNSKGVIDYSETAKRIISHESSIIIRFRLACMYCLENDIFQLWKELNEEHPNLLLQSNLIMDCFEVKFWTSYIKHNLSALMQEIQYIGNRDTLWFAFNVSVDYFNNVTWIKHFLKKMGEDQMCVVAYNKLKNILEMEMAYNYQMIPLLSCYVSSEMFDDLIFRYPGTILLQFLQFPTTDYFLKIADKTWNLSDDDFYKITEKIGHSLQEYDGNQIFKDIFQSFWENSPKHCKIYVIRKCIDGSFLNRLGLLKHSSPIIKQIAQSSTMDQRKEMIFSYNGILFFDSLIRKSRWSCFYMSVQEFSGSEDRENWIDELISTYQRIFETSRFPSFTDKDFKKLIDVLEKLKYKNAYSKLLTLLHQKFFI